MNFRDWYRQKRKENNTGEGRVQLVIQINDIIVSYCVIPLINRGSVSAFSNSLQGYGKVNGWDTEFWNIEDWTRSG